MNPPEPDLKAVFSRALDLPAGPERSAYLDEACSDDAVLRLQVEALLAAHDEAGGFLRSATAAPASLPGAIRDHFPEYEDDLTLIAADPAIAEGPGATIGPYKLLQEIGEGGMGTVFMAEQEKPVRRRVALKVIKPGMDTRQVIARFEAERQALAMMEHPNIARVLDVGATAAGRPYFVMELVHGVSITQYCDENHLTTRERLELFIPVCQALQHAHQKGVVHRDVKPSNVLVTVVDGAPTPKVIDFGIAKAIDQRLTERTMFTEFGAVIGTLEYMSPEQAEMGAMDVDTRSDVYSLGVLLYELLTGSTPLQRARLREAGYSEILRRIREEEPAKPSTRLSESRDALPSISARRKVEPARLARLVRGDLDWIVMKALEKDRGRRYETASGFARDVQRHLDGDAVEASPPSRSYKFRKLARKHRVALATAGAFALLLVVATAVSAGLAVWANNQRIRAEAAEYAAVQQRLRVEDRERLSIDAVGQFTGVLATSPELMRSAQLSQLRVKLLKDAQFYFNRLRDQLMADGNATSGTLELLARKSSTLHFLASGIGEKDQVASARDAAMESQQRLIDDLERRSREDPDAVVIPKSNILPHWSLAYLLFEAGRKAEAVAMCEKAVEFMEREVRKHPNSRDYQFMAFQARSSVGGYQYKMGLKDEGLTSLDQSISMLDRLTDANPSAEDYRLQQSAAYLSLGGLKLEVGRRAEAVALYERALAVWDRLARERPDSHKPAAGRSIALIQFSILDLNERRFDEARTKIAEAFELRRNAVAKLKAGELLYAEMVRVNRDLARVAEKQGLVDVADSAGRFEFRLRLAPLLNATTEEELAGALQGPANRDAAEKVQLAYRAYVEGRYAESARRFSEGFELDRWISVRCALSNHVGYDAACAAALALAGRGEDAPPDAVAKAELRRQALEWLRADLTAWAENLDGAPYPNRGPIATLMKHWKTDPDLAAVRDDEALSKLPEAERAAFKKLWSDVDHLLASAMVGA